MPEADKVAEIDVAANALKSSILAASSIAISEDATVYYVADNGNDNNNGTEESPFKTISKVNEVVAAANGAKTVICFKRGDTFRGQLLAQSNVTYTAYGTGDKPIITVSPENGAVASNWSLVSGTTNIWRYSKQLNDVGCIFFNDSDTYAAKRCPNIVNGEYEFGIEALDDMQFISLTSVEDALRLNNNNANEIYSTLYLRCDAGNPGEVFDSIEFSQRLYVVFLPSFGENITVDNLSIKYGGAHGVGGSSQTNLLVQNCEIAFIGGGVQYYLVNSTDANTYIPARYGNGVEVNTACDGYVVKNCWVHDIYDSGITHQQGDNFKVPLAFKNVEYSNNLIENCLYSIEYFACNSATTDDYVKMINITISDNIMRNAGYGFTEHRTLQSSAWNMGVHIMGWYKHNNYAENFVIKNNIFDRSIYNDLTNDRRINSSFILVSAVDAAYLPDFEGNTYVHYVGSRFGYYGLNVFETFDRSYLSVYTEDFSVADFLGDTTGETFFLNADS